MADTGSLMVGLRRKGGIDHISQRTAIASLDLEENFMKTHVIRCAALAAVTLSLAGCAGGADNTDTTAADTTAAVAAVAATGSTTGAAGGAAPTATGMIDPNSATQQQLMTAGLDSAAAAAIIAGRPHADMRAVDRALSGRNLTADQRKAAYATLWKPIDLNTATDAEILLIPGIGNRMLHEFKEYRPYTSMEQFRREIGKYVDQNEVARLEKYVMIK
jgi:DNA uptake protein ComE-like DNA-binding protein